MAKKNYWLFIGAAVELNVSKSNLLFPASGSARSIKLE